MALNIFTRNEIFTKSHWKVTSRNVLVSKNENRVNLEEKKKKNVGGKVAVLEH